MNSFASSWGSAEGQVEEAVSIDRDSRRVYVVLELELTLAFDDHDRAPRPKGRAPHCLCKQGGQRPLSIS